MVFFPLVVAVVTTRGGCVAQIQQCRKQFVKYISAQSVTSPLMFTNGLFINRATMCATSVDKILQIKVATFF